MADVDHADQLPGLLQDRQVGGGGNLVGRGCFLRAVGQIFPVPSGKVLGVGKAPCAVQMLVVIIEKLLAIIPNCLLVGWGRQHQF